MKEEFFFKSRRRGSMISAKLFINFL